MFRETNRHSYKDFAAAGNWELVYIYKVQNVLFYGSCAMSNQYVRDGLNGVSTKALLGP